MENIIYIPYFFRKETIKNIKKTTFLYGCYPFDPLELCPSELKELFKKKIVNSNEFNPFIYVYSERIINNKLEYLFHIKINTKYYIYWDEIRDEIQKNVILKYYNFKIEYEITKEFNLNIIIPKISKYSLIKNHILLENDSYLKTYNLLNDIFDQKILNYELNYDFDIYIAIISHIVEYTNIFGPFLLIIEETEINRLEIILLKWAYFQFVFLLGDNNDVNLIFQNGIYSTKKKSLNCNLIITTYENFILFEKFFNEDFFVFMMINKCKKDILNKNCFISINS